MVGRDRVVRLALIFAVSGLLCLVSIARVIFHENNPMFDMLMTVLVVFLLCCLVEMCWRGAQLSSANEGSDGAEERNDDATSAVWDSDSIFMEPPPSYEEMVAQGEIHPPDGGEEAGKTDSEDQQDIDLIILSQEEDAPDSLDPRTHPQANRRHSAYAASQELQLSVEGLPTYEEAVSILQQQHAEAPDPGQDNNLILFI